MADMRALAWIHSRLSLSGSLCHLIPTSNMLVSIIVAVSLVAGAHSACPGGGSTCDQTAAMAAYVTCSDNSACTSGTVCSNYDFAIGKSCRISAETHLNLFLDLFHSYKIIISVQLRNACV